MVHSSDLQELSHSNFSLDLSESKDGYHVWKSCSGDLAARLEKQYKKQLIFQEHVNSHNVLPHFIEVAQTLDSVKEQDLFKFCMKFYNGTSIIDLIENKDILDTNFMLDSLFIFLEYCFENASPEILNKEVFTKKLDSIQGSLTQHQITTMKNIIEACENSQVPVGPNHGDLTFSNVILSKKLVLIDFLDNFYESPLQDVAKILQETNLQWSHLLDKKKRDHVKIDLAYRHIRRAANQKIRALMQKRGISQESLDMFYYMNILRILPYTKEESIYNKLTHELHRAQANGCFKDD